MDTLTFEQLPQAVNQLFDKLEQIERLLKEKSNPPQPESDKILTVDQAAEFLSLTVPTVYGLVQKKTVPYMKRGKRLYFSQDELREWIKSGRKRTAAETEAIADQFLSKKKGS